MKTIEEIKAAICRHQAELATDYKVSRLAIFGSYTRGDETEDSDIDILVEFTEPVGLLFVHLADHLEDLLGAKVDLVTRDGIKPNRWPYIKEELIYV